VVGADRVVIMVVGVEAGAEVEETDFESLSNIGSM
jgi:hypothetical protein